MSEHGISREHVVWAYRLLLDREPESEQAILPKLRAWRTARELRTDIMASAEYGIKNPDAAQTGAQSLVIKPIGEARLWIDLADQVIGIPILRDRYEPDVLAMARALLRPGDTAVDVGAHIGFFTVHFAQLVGPAGRVHAFEPLARNAALLERSITESRFQDRIELRRAAVADRAGEVVLRFAAETLNTGGAFIGDRAMQVDAALAAETVPSITLDTAELRRPVRLIKMDVEGAEPFAIAGATRVLSEDRPYVISEVHPEQLQRVANSSPAALLATLDGLGYGAYHIDAGQIGPPLRAEHITGVTTVVLAPR